MLNMIPMDIITKHDSLKNVFVKGDIMQAVKWFYFYLKILKNFI